MLIDITLDEANLIEDALDLYIYSADSFISYDELMSLQQQINPILDKINLEKDKIFSIVKN